MPPKKLLLVDDEIEILNILQEIFEECSWEVRTATNGKDTPVILLTAFRDAEKMQRAWESCVYDFVDKPFQPDKIVALVDSAREFGSEYVRTARRRFQKIRSAKKTAI